MQLTSAFAPYPSARPRVHSLQPRADRADRRGDGKGHGEGEYPDVMRDDVAGYVHHYLQIGLSVDRPGTSRGDLTIVFEGQRRCRL